MWQHWYYVYIALLVILAVGGKARHRLTWLILLGAAGLSIGLRAALGSIDAPWTLLPFSCIELVTIVTLLALTYYRLGCLQCFALSAAVVAHLLCYLDLVTGSNMVYDRYETYLVIIALAQLALGTDDLMQLFRRLAQLARPAGHRQHRPAMSWARHRAHRDHHPLS